MNKLAAMFTFRRVVELGSFTAAARELDLSNAGVSKHVRELEAELGVALLVRTTRRIALTEAGRGYFERAVSILDAVDAAEAELGLLQGEAVGRLRISAPVSLGVLHLAPLLAEFCRLHPRLRPELVLDDRLVDLVAEGFDVALRVRRSLADSSLVARRVCGVQRLLVAAPAYLADHGVPDSLDALAGHRLLGFSHADTSDAWSFIEEGAERTLAIEPTLRANVGIALREALLAGAGIGYSPDFIVGADVRAGRLQRVLPTLDSPPLALHVVFPSSRLLPPKVRVFVDFVLERFAVPPWRAL